MNISVDTVQRSASAHVRRQSKQLEKQSVRFSQLMEQLNAGTQQHSTSAPRLRGDYISSFEINNPTAADTAAKPHGDAAASPLARDAIIDKTSPLYQQALELESYFVKIMLDSMRSSLGNTALTGKNSFAGKMYEDMMYEELSRTMTKNAGLGLADQVYLQLKQ